MSNEEKVQRAGRIEYIEPNSLFVSSSGNTVQNGIPQPYENYSFSVNLRVVNGNRYDCGMTGEEEDIQSDFIEFSSERGTINFMEGTANGNNPGYLTTNFTDISMNDPGTNTRECLGIESITIKYSSYYTPTVDIKFIDVRGASLMQPSEYEYYNNGEGNINRKDPATTNSDFFKAFFSFPYPLFKLSVKGFYGKEVTYDLSVVNCNIDFNASTGNFEISASFIGYMYGLYADMPFPFIYLAPYIDLYGKNIWDERIKSEDFWYLDIKSDDDTNAEGGNTNFITLGRNMYTFPELKIAVDDANEQVKKQSPISPEGREHAELTNLKNIMADEVVKNYPAWKQWSKTNDKSDPSGYFFAVYNGTPEANRGIFEKFYSFSKGIHKYNEVASEADEARAKRGKNVKVKDDFSIKLINTHSVYEDIYQGAQLVIQNKESLKRTTDAETSSISSDFTDEDIKKILDEEIVTLAFRKDASDKEKPTLKFDEKTSSPNALTTGGYSDLVEELTRQFNERVPGALMLPNTTQVEWIIRAYKTNNTRYIDEIRNIQSDIDDRINALDSKLKDLMDLDIQKAIGFKPTIRNLYNMVFAHIDTFMSVFYNMLDRIRKSIQSDTDESRLYTNFCGNGVEIDVNENALNKKNGKIPPFTMFYYEETAKDSKDKNLKSIWPGALHNGGDLEEVKLVEAIVNATALSKKRYDSVTPKYNIPVKRGALVPISYYDIINNDKNPYLTVLTRESLDKPDIVNKVLQVFLYRSFFSLLNGSYVGTANNTAANDASSAESNYTKKANLIAKIEIENLKRAFQSIGTVPGQRFITELEMTPSNGYDIISRYTNEGKLHFVSDNAGRNLSYNWIKWPDYNFYPLGEFEPSVLENLAKNAGNKEGTLKGRVGKFLKINDSGTSVNGTYACRIYKGGSGLEDILGTHASGDYAEATKLFPTYKKIPSSLDGISFYDGTFTDTKTPTFNDLYNGVKSSVPFSGVLRLPSARITQAGITNIFTDPLYYAQTTPEARAYIFLMGVPMGEDKKFLLPKRLENGAYPTILLLREGAIYWRNDFIYTTGAEDVNNDPITYKFSIDGVENDVLADIEKNDPVLGRSMVLERYENDTERVSEGRRQYLIDYFLKWVSGSVNGLRPNAVTPESDTRQYRTTLPEFDLDFQTIERTFAFNQITNKVTNKVKTALFPDSSQRVVKELSVGPFANADTLKEVYNTGLDDKLGKITANVRQDVFLRNPADIKNEGLKATLEQFKKLYTGFDTIIDFSYLDNPSPNFSVPKSAVSDALSAFISGIKDEYKVSPSALKDSTKTKSTGEAADDPEKIEHFPDDDLKLACYIALKNLYDKWLCSRSRSSWYFSCNPDKILTDGSRSDFNRFFYLDEFYHNIGMQVKPNLTEFVAMTADLGNYEKNSSSSLLASSSILKVLSSTAQKAGCALLPLPTMLGLAKSGERERNTVADVFTAFPYNEAVKTSNIESSFVVLYSNQKSSFLNIPSEDGKMAYKPDGFDIADTWGKIIPITSLSDNTEDGYVVPAFGVTFAKQNQSYFKNVSLSMSDHQITEYSIRNQLQISYGANKAPTETVLVGQDLYSVFANYSYSCSVTMMGDAQITPLMYFQLNNIPMWKGAYLITTVQHNISVNGMETTFIGVRQARPSMPFKNEKMIFASSDDNKNTAQSQEPVTAGEELKEVEESSSHVLNNIVVNDVKSAKLVVNRTSYSSSENKINGILSLRVSYDNFSETGTVANLLTITDYKDIALTQEITDGLNGSIENYEATDTDKPFSIPYGAYTNISLNNVSVDVEYRKSSDDNYKFTEGRHIIISDKRLGSKKCEIIPGVSADTLTLDETKDFSIGGTSPVMLYPFNSTRLANIGDASGIQGVYKEVFDFIDRMQQARKPISIVFTETDEVKQWEPQT